MENIKKLKTNLKETNRYLDNYVKVIKKQQKALIKNEIQLIQETALLQVDLMKNIGLKQDELKNILIKINKNYSINLPTDKFEILKDKISDTLHYKIENLIIEQNLYFDTINSYLKNNQILFENALSFVQQQIGIIVEAVKSKPFYKGNNKINENSASHILNKKL